MVTRSCKPRCENEEKWFRRWEEERAEMQKAEAEAQRRVQRLHGSVSYRG